MEYKKNGEQISRVKRTIKLYAKMLMSNKIDWIKLKNVYNRTIKDEFAELNIRKIIRLKESQKMIESEILAEYELQGITPKSVITDERDILSVSFGINDMSNARQIVHKWGSRVGLDPKEIKTTISLKGTNYNALLEANEPDQLGVVGEAVKQIEQSNDKTD